MSDERPDLVVAGAGGGLVGALRAAELGLDVLVVEAIRVARSSAIRRARATTTLSSSVSSSMPRMAMMSCRSA